MRRYVGLFLVVTGVILLMGCEGDWSAGGGVDGWSERYNWVTFNGVYKGINGGVLVTDYTSSVIPGAPGKTNAVTDEVVAIADGSKTKYSGVFSHDTVVPGSVQITVSGFMTLTDDGSGHLSGGGADGSVTYGTGAWSIDLKGLNPDSGTQILGSYQYSISGSSAASSSSAGSSGVTIYSFTVFQQGQRLEFTDNNGSKYTGEFGSIRSTSAVSQDDVGTPVTGDSVIGAFQVQGTSASGFWVTIEGTLQGVVGSGEGTFMLSNRQMFGTWIEDGGRTGDVNGEASPISISVSTSSDSTSSGT